MNAVLLPFVANDGGRAAAGYRGQTGDCAARATAIATGMPYQAIYSELVIIGRAERRRTRKPSHPRTGVWREAMDRLLIEKLGFTWTPTMEIGSGCQVHLAEGELPGGRLVVSLSRHYAAVIDGVLNDTHDCSREGTRCVYGYWTAPAAERPEPVWTAGEGWR